MTSEAYNSNEPFLEYYQFLMTQENDEIPQVISNSYGDDEQVSMMVQTSIWPH